MKKVELLRGITQLYGGKGNMIAKLHKLVPAGGKPYCEPYVGGGSLFFSREPAPVEVINDLDGDLINLFRCFQDRELFEELRHRLMWTPYARAEFGRAIDILNDPQASRVDRAWAFFVAKNQGLSGVSETIGDWSRTFCSHGGMAGTTSRWLMRLSMIDAWRWRLMRVQIDNRDALEVIRYWDNENAVFYLDPPYHPDTRKDKDAYGCEADAQHHEMLVELLLTCRGAVVLSGYDHTIYRRLDAAGWQRFEFETACHAAGRGRGSGLIGEGAAMMKVPRVEVVWCNPRAAKLCHVAPQRPQQQLELPF